jgi:1-acyl-sn-glycerol-3-phosphate acyltransferase
MKKFALIITNIVLGLLFRVEVVNRHKIPSEGSALLCANHNTLLDMFFLGYKIDRWVNWMAKEELFKNPVLAFILKKLGAFPVKRGTGDVGSIKTAYQLLDKGEIVGIFPQGTRINPEKLETQRVKPGAAMIAVNTGVPIIPATVQGSYKLFSKMKVIFGDPFVISNDQDKKYSKEDLMILSRDIIKRVYSLAEGS